MTSSIRKRGGGRVASTSFALFAVATALCSIACSDGTGAMTTEFVGGKEQPGPSASFDKYSIKAVIHAPDGDRSVQFTPANPMGSRDGSGSAKSGSATPSVEQRAAGADGGIGTSQQALIATATATGQPFDFDDFVKTHLANVSTDAFEPAWYLQDFAIALCGADIQHDRFQNQAPTVPGLVISNCSASDTECNAESHVPWSTRSVIPPWHRFDSSTINSCDDWLKVQEVLLCVADRFGEIADAVAPVTWDVTSASNPPIHLLTFPVQSQRDKFIIRDMAINLLAHVAYADFAKLVAPMLNTEGADALSCTDAYGRLAQQGNNQDLWTDAFGSDETQGTKPLLHFPPVGQFLSAANVQAVATQRVAYKTHVLRAASRLLRDLVDKSVDADVAGAEQQRATAGDPVDGARRMWGTTPLNELDSIAPFNTLRHALRTLAGRLEMGPDFQVGDVIPQSTGTPAFDPACHGVKSLFLASPNPAVSFDLLDAVGSGITARWSDVPATTDGQALATSLITNLGIVLPPNGLARGANPADKVRTLLIYREAQKAGLCDENFGPASTTCNIVAFAPFVQNDSRFQSAIKVLDGISSDDIVFGLDRGWDAFRLLTDAPERLGTDPTLLSVLPQFAANAGLPFATDGLLLKGRIPRSDIFIDTPTEMSRAIAASHCGDDSFANGPGVNAIRAFQNVFMLGDTFRRRIGIIRDRFATAGGDAFETANMAEGEIKSWVGPGHVYYSHTDTAVHVFDITGLDSTWFDVDASSLSTLVNRLALVRGGPHDAECVAGTRTSCGPTPPEMGTLITSGPDAPALLPSGNSVRLGNDGAALHVAFNLDQNIFSPGVPLFLVLKDAPGSQAHKGRVLVTLGYLPSGQAESEVVSDYRQSLLEDTFGLATKTRKEETCVGDDSTTSSKNYCVQGIERNMFVPLANELTSTSANSDTEDSWKHYLGLAQQASNDADELGRKLVEFGLDQESRREAAQEELGQLCGDFVAASGLKVDDGTVSTPDNQNANTCFAEPTYDLVFLGHNPFGDDKTTLGGDELQAIKDVFCKTKAQPSTAGFCGKTSITVAALKFGTSAPQPKPTDCKSAEGVASSFRNGVGNPSDLSNEGLQDYAKKEELDTALQNLQFRVFGDGTWDLLLRGEQVMRAPILQGTPAAVQDNTGMFPLCTHIPTPSGTPPTCNEAAAVNECGPVNGPAHCVAGVCSMCTGLAAELQHVFPAGDDFSIGKEVERAVFFMGAVNANLPAGKIGLPLPAVNFATATTPASAVAVYGPSLFDSTVVNQNTVVRLREDPKNVNDLDAAWFGDGFALPADYANKLSAWATANVPGGWFDDLGKRMKSAPGDFVMASAYNSSINFKHNRFHDAIAALVTSASQGNGGLEKVNQFATCALDPSGDFPLFEETTQTDFSISVGGGTPGCNNQICFFGWTNPVNPYIVLNDDFSGPAIDGQPSAPLSLFAPGVNDNSLGSNFGSSNACGAAYPTFPVSGNFDMDQRLNAACANSSSKGVYTKQTTLPRRCPPCSRVGLIANHWEPSKSQQGALMAQVLALSCLATGGAVSNKIPDAPATAESVEDLARLAIWTKQVGNAANDAVNALFLENVPASVVDAFATGRVAEVGITNEGAHGQDLLDLRAKLEQIFTGWSDTASGIRQLGNALDAATVALELANVSHQQRLLDIATAEVSLDKDLAVASLGVMAATASGMTGVEQGVIGGAVSGAAGGPFGALAGAALGGLTSLLGASNQESTALAAQQVSEQFAERQRNILSAQALAQGQVLQNQQQTVFVDLAKQTEDLHKNIQNSISQMRESTAGALSTIAALRGNQNQARFEAAKAAGVDFFRDSQGNVVAMPVNTVYRREYDITQRRYKEALERAKRLAYLTRLAMEQRIGVRLSALNEPIGPLPAPALWADDVCSVQGIDYQALRDASNASTVNLDVSTGGAAGTGGTAPILVNVNPTSEKDTIGQFADQFVGDYVAKLSDFMEFYNIQFPFREADDRAVISLRKRLIAKNNGCQVESKNLLFFSDQLFHGAGAESPATNGWEVNPCGSDTSVCLAVRATPPNGMNGLPPVSQTQTLPPIVPPGGVGGVSWLLAVAGGANSSITPGSPSGLASPPLSVYQAVPLNAQGHYVLSWWDRTLNADGSIATSGSSDYRAIVYGSDFTPVADLPLSSSAITGDVWSERNTLDFVAPTSGTYYVTFSLDRPTVGTSIALANVQMQLATANDGFASGYEQTTDKRVVFTSDCGDQPGSIQDAFEYRCQNGTCFYDLKAPFTINTAEIEARDSSLTGLVGSGNYNHRHLTMAVNAVGTGVLDCTKNPTPECYGSAFLEYDLLHDAFDVPMVDYGGQPRCFTFGTGAIRGGKALAAERYITFPVSSSDEALIGQDGILRPEFAGRPLSGSYRLRIYDNPALNFQHIDDIQIILGYRVWSRVTRTPGN